jgi:ankyrin repeat protein
MKRTANSCRLYLPSSPQLLEPIAVAGVFSQPRAVKTFIKLGADVNARDTSQPTELMLAAEINNAEIVNDLIAANADIRNLLKRTQLAEAQKLQLLTYRE